MINLKKAMVKGKRSYGTFMFIPESQQNVKAYRIPLWLTKAMVISVIFVTAMCCTSLWLLSSIKVQHEASKKEIKVLTAINNSQKLEIEKLKKDSEQVHKQLEENSRLLDEVKKAVGISPSKDNVFVDSSSDNTSSEQTKVVAVVDSPDLSEEISSVEESFKALSGKLLSQKQEIEESIAPIKSRLAYLAAKPSILPVNAPITAGFGYRKNPFTSRGSEFHRGVDFAAHYGQSVKATGDGIVTYAGWYSSYGKVVIISHGYGLTTLYAHNSKILVKQGDKVKKGQEISKVGSTGRSTGTHLHYEVKLNGKNVDPSKYFQ